MKLKKQFYFLFLILLLATAVWFPILIRPQIGFLEIDFFDVGQGDAILIKTAAGQTMLIDGGPNSKILRKLGEHFAPHQKRIDIIMLTHPHADHVSGLIEIARRYEIGIVLMSGAQIKTAAYLEFLRTLADRQIPVAIASAGVGIHFNTDTELDILSPQDDKVAVFGKNNEGFGAAGNDINDASVIGKLFFKDFSALLMGDATSKIEKGLLSYSHNLVSDILKVGHHGSKYSSSSEFLNLVEPKAAVIQAGLNNRYGHPTQAALGRLKSLSVSTFRTDKDGDVRILSDGYATSIYKSR